MTEEEAKTKWCPAFRGNDHGINRPLDLDSNALVGRCIASACMAWRWRLDYGAPDPVDGRVWTSPGPSSTEGYCGLAGVPS